MVAITEPGIYRGTLRHRRFRPRAHEFSYPVFMAMLDIDRIPETMARSVFSGYNRFNWATFAEGDHFGDAALSLRQRLALDAAAHGVPLPQGRVMLLTNLRYLGYCFNPISFFYFVDEKGRVPVVLAEVNSTFGESRNYWLWQGNQTSTGALKFECAKAMHVSPFMPMELTYGFVLTPPGKALTAHMETVDGTAPLFDATLSLTQHPWTSRELLKALISYPAMTVKVMFAIHWQALRLWLKRVPVFTHPDRRE